MKTKQTSIQNKQGKTGSELLSRPEQLSSDKTEQQPQALPRLDYDLRRQNRTLPTDKVLALLKQEAPRVYELAEVVGKWVWVQFTDKQPREVTAALSQLGFHWNNKRKVWQHPCGELLREQPATDPRQRYLSHFPADLKAA